MPILDALIEDGLASSALRQTVGGVKVLKELFIAIRSDAPPGTKIFGDGSQENPFAGNTAEQFDGVMTNFALEDYVVHLGPGLFRTKGSPGTSVLVPGWVARSGQRIIGAGMFNTTLRISAQPPTLFDSVEGELVRFFSAVGQSDQVAVDNFEISDLTIDLNLGGQPAFPGDPVHPPPLPALPYPRLALGAVHVVGRNNRIRRVRVINFGTRTPSPLNGTATNQTHEAFILWNTGPQCVTEDCIIQQPYESNARETTICITGGEGSVLRNNFYDLDFVNPLNGFATAVVSMISDMASPTSTISVRTRFPHNVKAGDYIEVKGASPSEYNSRWLVVSPSTEDPLSRDLTFQMPTPSGQASGAITVEQSFLQTMRATSVSWLSGALTITTGQKHWRQVNDWVIISGCELVTIGGVSQDINGSYQVSGGVSAFSFQVALAAGPTGSIKGEIWLDRRTSFPRRIGNLSSDTDESDFWLLWDGLSDGKLLDAFAMCEPYVHVRTLSPHLRKPGEWITLGGYGDTDPYRSYFQIDRVISTTELVIIYLGSKLQVELPIATVPVSGGGAIFGSSFQAMSINGNPNSTAERNRVLNTLQGGDYHDTWPCRDSITRKNYFYNIFSGVYHTLGLLEWAGWGGVLGPRQGNVVAVGPDFVEVETAVNPAYPPVVHYDLDADGIVFFEGAVFQIYTIANFRDPPPPPPTAATSAIVISNVVRIPGGSYSYRFKFKTPSPNPFAVTTPAQVVEFWQFCQQMRLVVEDNIFDMALMLPPTDTYSSGSTAAITALLFYQTLGKYPDLANHPVIQDFIVRSNLIRPIDNQVDPHLEPPSNSAFGATSCERLICSGNILNRFTMPPDSQKTFTIGLVNHIGAFNNQTNAGEHLRLNYFYYTNADMDGPHYRNEPQRFISDLYDESDDWLMGF